MGAVRATIGNFAAGLASRLLAALHNHWRLQFTREEFRFLHVSFSQFGEDLAVERWLERFDGHSLLYVDVGCFHPIHHSNTLLLSKRGWRGVNVDMDSYKIEAFDELRPSDWNVVAALSSSARPMHALSYEGGGTNRLVATDEVFRDSAIGTSPLAERQVSTTTLDELLERAPFPIPDLGYINIDCEGHDLEVLMGLDLDRYRPTVVTIEALSAEEQARTRIHLETRGYILRETIYRTQVYTRADAGAGD